MQYLLDTNILSEPLKAQPNHHVIQKLNTHKAHCVTATIVIQEMVFGYQTLAISKRRQLIEYYVRNIISVMPILTYSLESAIWHGEERARLKKKGKTPAFVDGQIVAIARVNNAILVTRNVTDFKHFADITIENWFVEQIS